MAEHTIPDRLLKVITADLLSRSDEEGPNSALVILRALPEIGDSTELEISWYSENDLGGATLNITAHSLTLAVNDQDGMQEIYCCDANCYPRVDRDDFEPWITYLCSLAAPEIAISSWS